MTTEKRPALIFDGLDDFIDLGPRTDYELSDALSLEAWIYVDEWKAKAGIFTKFMDYQGDESGFAIMLDEAHGLIFALKPEFELENVSVSSGKDSLAAKSWHHVSATFDGATMKVYIDGALMGQKQMESSVGYSPENNLFIGLTRDGDGVDKFFHGMIGQVRLWDHARTPEQLRDNADKRLAGDEPGLVGYWPLDEGSGDKAGDESGLKQTGKIEGGAKWTDSDVPFPHAANPRETESGSEPEPKPKPAPKKLSGIINPAVPIVTGSADQVKITGVSPAFEVGDRVLLVQMTGATVATSNDDKYGSVTKLNGAGQYEFARIASVDGGDYTLTATLKQTFGGAGGSAQMIKVSEHEGDVEVGDVQVHELTAVDGNMKVRYGGVIVIEASGTIELTGTVDASAKGFPGGAISLVDNDVSTVTTLGIVGPSGLSGSKGSGISDSKDSSGRGAMANGGGGGNRHNSGGAGGGNCGAGGAGGKTVVSSVAGGLGGYALAHENRLFLGGGGGGGHANENNGTAGGVGGGIVFLKAKAITGTAAILRSNGASVTSSSQSDGGGGGGAGGTIVLDAEAISGDIKVEVEGGTGGNVAVETGPGGGGGGGRVLWAKPLPDSVSVSFVGGNAGLWGSDNRGAAAGAAGCSYKLEPAGTEGGHGAGTKPSSDEHGLPAVIDTSGALTAALERLNRKSIIKLLEAMAAELDAHCNNPGGDVDAKIKALRDELHKQIDNLRNSTDANKTKLDALTKQLLELKKSLKIVIDGLDGRIDASVKTELDHRTTQIIKQIKDQLDKTVQDEVDKLLGSDKFGDLKKTIDAMKKELEALEKASHELSEGELKTIEKTIEKTLKGMDLTKILDKLRIEINGKSYALDDLLRKLANRPVVSETNYGYKGADLTRVEYVLSNGKHVKFMGKRVERPELDAVDLEFSSADLEGLPASFKLRFVRRTTSFSWCDETVGLDEYDALMQTNVVYDFGA